MKLIIAVFLLSCGVVLGGSCKTIEQSCGVKKVRSGRIKTIEQSCIIKPLEGRKIKTIKESCKIEYSLLKEYLAKLERHRKQNN